MNKKDIPIYRDPDNFEEGQVKYPCTTQRMEYNVLTHKYYLTVEVLEDYGIDVERDYISSSRKKIEQFIEEVTDDLYGVIMRLAPFNYQYMCWLVAQSRAVQFPDRYTARKQFEKALIYQAQYKLMNTDVRDINGIDLETNNNIYYKQLRREFRHISPKSLDILHGLGLLFNGRVAEKNLINYTEGM